jgi:RHS repeat-associated protein
MRGVSLVLLATFGFDSTALAQALITAPARIPAPAPVTAPIEPRPLPAPSYPESEAPLVETTVSSDPTTTTAEHTYPAGWNLVSVPLLPSNSSPAAVFDEVPAPLRLYDYVDGQVLANGDAGFRNVAPGRAFWMLLAAPVAVRVTGEPVATDAEYRIALKPGWNAVATPWLASIAWSDGQVWVRNGASTLALGAAVDQGWIEGTIDDPDPAGVYGALTANASPAGRLRPWRGYLLYSQISGELIFGAPPPDTTPPTVSFTGLADGAVVTAPTEIAGSIDDLNLVDWRLEYVPTDGGTAVVLGSGNGPVDGVLGTLDPTLLLNGTYDVRLVATDAGGQVTTLTHSVVVRDNFKVGNFSVSFVDLDVPLAGLPIRVTRTYDSRDKRRGDFGIGWRVELTNVRLTRNVAPGADWQGTVSGTQFPTYCIDAARTHLVTVTSPEGKVYEFEAVPAPQCQQFAPIDGATVTYRAHPGTSGTLLPVGGGDVLVAASWPGPLQLMTFSGEIFDPQAYRLTLPDGRSMVIDRQRGLQSVTDLNGNQLDVGPGGITHSSGKGVAFSRDGLGRITAITDPAGNVMTYGYDPNGNLENYTDREANITRYTYDASHGLLSILDPRGLQPIRNDYDESGRLIRHTDALGKTIEYTHDVAGRQEIITDRLGQARVLEYDERGNVVRETDAEGKVISRTFDAHNNLTTQTDPTGRTTTFVFDAQDRLTSRRDPLGNETRYSYDAHGKVLTVTNARGGVTTNTYDADGNPTSSQNAAGGTTTSTYALGQLASQTDPLGCTTRYEYDAGGNLAKAIDALGREATYTYDADGNRLSETTTATVGGQPQTIESHYEYDRLGRLVKAVDAEGGITRNVYDAQGNRTRSIDALGHETSYTYDEAGHLIRTLFPDGTTEEATYDAEDRRLTSTDRAGRTTSFAYDGRGLLVRTTLPDGSAILQDYDGAGRRLSTTDGRGNVTRYEYDAAGRQSKVIDPLGNTTSFTYDAYGNVASITDPRGQVTTYEHDVLNRRTRTAFPDGTESRTAWDAVGHAIAETDQAGLKTQYVYDCRGLLTQVIDARGQTTTYSYDELDRLVGQTDANGHTTRFEQDRQGRPTRRILPDGRFETASYDAAGNLIARTDFAGRTVGLAYDVNNRLLSRTYPDGSAVTFTYSPTGRRASATDARGTTTYEYDVRDRLHAITQPGAGRIEYAYDPNGNRTALTIQAGGSTLTTTYSHDKADRLASVIDPQARTYAYTYDAGGNPLSLAYPNGVSTTSTYDKLGRPVVLRTERMGTTIQSYAYTLDAVGHRSRVDELDATRSYEHDQLSRLVQETVGGAAAYQKAFTYDASLNRITQNDSRTGLTTYSYDERDRLVSEGGAAHSWDENGNLLTRGGQATYAWDFDNKLREVRKADGTLVTHAYDADGNRVQTRVTPSHGPPVVTNFLVDPSGPLAQVVAETDSLGHLTAAYVRGRRLLAVERGSVTRFYHADHLGSIRRLTDEAGQVTDAYTYDAFGATLSHEGSDPNPYQFAGEALQAESGLYDLRARWMDPASGRFVSADPFTGEPGQPLTANQYAYAFADPVDRVDPSGLSPEPIQCRRGKRAHELISEHYEKIGGTINKWVATKKVCGVADPTRPDIRFHVDAIGFPGTQGEVYEIKPKDLLAAAVLEAQGYADALNLITAYKPINWRPGDRIPPDPPVREGSEVDLEYAGQLMVVMGYGMGAITYHFVDNREPERVPQLAPLPQTERERRWNAVPVVATSIAMMTAVLILRRAPALIAAAQQAGFAQLNMEMSLSFGF